MVVILKKIVMLLSIFIVGWTLKGMSADFQHNYQTSVQGVDDIESKRSDASSQDLPTFFSSEPSDKASPYDRIKEEQIHVYGDKIVIDLQNAEWASFTDSNSMDPVIDIGSNAIEIVPNSPEDVHIGDLVSYESKFARGTIIHRVTEIGYDDKGWYCRLRGDNLEKEDPGKVRFSQIKRIVVAIIY